MRKRSPVFKNNLQDGYQRPQFQITGWQNFCSGGLICNIGGTISRGTDDPLSFRAKMSQRDNVLRQISHLDMEKLKNVDNHKDYWTWVYNHGNAGFGQSSWAVPLDLLYDSILYQIWVKADTGEGGENMYGHNKYPCKTFAIADRYDKSDDQVSCWGLQNHIMKLSRRRKEPFMQYAQMGELVPGAHGGMCRGALFSFLQDRYYVNHYFAVSFERIQKHIDYNIARWEMLRKAQKPEGLDSDEKRLQDELVNGW